MPSISVSPGPSAPRLAGPLRLWLGVGLAVCAAALTTAPAAASEIIDAVDSLDLPRLKALLAADPNCIHDVDANGASILQVAVMSGMPELRSRYSSGLVPSLLVALPIQDSGATADELLRYLIDHGAPVNAVDRSGDTALITAARWVRVSPTAKQFVKLLLESGADLYHVQPRSGESAAEELLRADSAYALPLLIDRHFDFHRRDGNNETVAQWALHEYDDDLYNRLYQLDRTVPPALPAGLWLALLALLSLPVARQLRRRRLREQPAAGQIAAGILVVAALRRNGTIPRGDLAPARQYLRHRLGLLRLTAWLGVCAWLALLPAAWLEPALREEFFATVITIVVCAFGQLCVVALLTGERPWLTTLAFMLACVEVLFTAGWAVIWDFNVFQHLDESANTTRMLLAVLVLAALFQAVIAGSAHGPTRRLAWVRQREAEQHATPAEQATGLPENATPQTWDEPAQSTPPR